MVSSRRHVSSPTSSCSSYCDLWERQEDDEVMSVDKRRDQGRDVERFFYGDDREVARRVLEDLEHICFDGSDEESEDEGEYDLRLECGSNLSSCSSQFSRKAGGMTLEELTVAVNAAIEYHRPTQPNGVESTDKISMDKINEVRQKFDERHRRHHRKYLFTGSSIQTGESVMEMFEDMLKRKEKHFYALRAKEIAAEDEMRDNKRREITTSRTVTANQHQQTTSCVRDQATETEEFENSFSHYPVLNESVAEFDTQPHSPLPGLAPYELVEPIAGPTLADLAHSHRRNTKHPLSFQSFPASESSKSSSSSSSTTDPAFAKFQSSFGSEYSASSRSSRSSTKSDICCQHSQHTSRNGNGSSRTSNKVSSSSRSSKHTSRKRVSRESPIETTQPNITLAKKDHAEEFSQVGVASLPSDPPQVPSRPELVAWELDLSNFAF